MSVRVVQASEMDSLRRKWIELDVAGYEAAAADPFKAFQAKGYSYGYAANPTLGGYNYRAWIRLPGVGKPLQAGGPSLMVAFLTLLCRALHSHERVLN